MINSFIFLNQLQIQYSDNWGYVKEWNETKWNKDIIPLFEHSNDEMEKKFKLTSLKLSDGIYLIMFNLFGQTI